MKLDDFDYHLPDALIAQTPAEQRDASRMLVLHRDKSGYDDQMFSAFPNFLKSGDCLVMNNTRVLPARIYGNKASGGKVEALLLSLRHDGSWSALLKPGRRLQPGTKVKVQDSEMHFEVLSREDEVFRIRFDCDDIMPELNRIGHMPLPPYISRADTRNDKERYQTVFAEIPGAVAAPTAGLHFTDDILAEIEASGVKLVYVTLHVGLGTFLPVQVDDVEKHRMHSEWYELTADAAQAINQSRAAGGRIFAVGTTSVRVLESCVDEQQQLQPGHGETDIFLYPPYKPRAVDGLLTNFHLPKSTLLMLVSCFVSRESLLDAYNHAISEEYRFFSYGDCMLLNPV